MARRYLITGGAGFIGSNFIRYVLTNEPTAEVVNLDLLTYAGVRATVEELDADPRHHFVHGDIRDAALVDTLVADCDVLVNFAAESHVDRSIVAPRAFFETNVVGTCVLIEAARQHGVARFVQISTDEVYGAIAEGQAAEDAPLAPSSPYAASKAAADLLVRSCAATHGFRAIITRCTNNYGPYQFPEKILPLFVTNLIDGQKVPLYGTGANQRDWLHVEDHCAALQAVIERGQPGEIYNIGTGSHITNLELTRRVLAAMGQDESLIDFVADRPGHDLRYAVDAAKVHALGWEPRHTLDERLVDTITWYRDREDWWRPLKETRLPR